jgi:hypothetical protein
MKTYLLAACLILAGCSRQEAVQREARSEQAGVPVRWAFANRRDIDSAIFQWSRDKMEEVKKAETLSPEVQEQVRQYEALETELMHKRMDRMQIRMPLPPGQTASVTPATDKEYEALAQKVADAKAPITDILDRRSKQASQYQNQYTTEKLIAEYVKNRFDLIVDSSDERMSRPAVLYRSSGEALDITDGVIKLFKENVKL